MIAFSFQILNWLYQSSEVGGSGQLDARIHVYDGRLWVDRGGGGDNTEGDVEGAAPSDQPSFTPSQTEVENERRNQKQRESLSSATMSQLLVDKAQMFHSGRYVCSALGASGTWTLVHILAGKTCTATAC